MSSKKNSLVYHSMASKPNSLAIDADIVQRLGFDGLETSGSKISAFLNAGYTEQELKERLRGFELPGIGFLIDLERQGAQRDAMLREAEDLCRLAVAAGAKGIEAITGPLDIRVFDQGAASTYPGLYRGLIDRSTSEQISLTAANLAAAADIAAKHGLIVYLEVLSWTPLNKIDHQLAVIDSCERENVKLVIDFWHSYTSGDPPERISRINRDLIYGVHFCDSLQFEGRVPNEQVLRDVATGKGVLNLREWVDAVKATGFEGWWSCELFCNRQHQDNSYEVAKELKALMSDLILA